MNNSTKWLLAGAAALLMVSAPMTATPAGAPRFRHVQSLYMDDQGVGLRMPQGVACQENGALVVADTGNGRLLRYTSLGDAPTPQVTVLKPSAMVYPQRIRLSPQGHIYVLDGKLHRIMHLTPEGAYLGFIDPVGLPPPAEFVTRSFDIDQRGNIYFLDILSKRVLVCNARGEYSKQIRFPEAYGFFSDLAVDAGGNIFLVDSVNAQVFSAKTDATRFSPLSQKLKAYARFPTSLILDRQGRIYLVDRNGSKIVILARDGAYVGKLSTLGWNEGLLNHPTEICLNDLAELFVADTSNNRIQKFVEVK